MSPRDEVHPLDASLADLTHAMRWAANSDVGQAIVAHLVAASQLMPLRHVEELSADDRKYLDSAITWGTRGREAVTALYARIPTILEPS